MSIEIVPCRLSHIRAIVPRLRREEQIELAAIDGKSRHVLISLWRETVNPYAAVANDQVVAVWGDAAPPLSHEGLVWFFTSGPIESIPVTFARIARQEIERMLLSRKMLRSSVHRSCTRALRFYDLLGFKTVEGAVREGFVEIQIARAA